MGLLRKRRGLGGTRYRLREKLFAIGDDFWIETEGGERSYKVNGKALRIRSTFIIESPSGQELFKIQEKKLRVRDTMRLERDGETIATIRKALVSPLRHRFKIEVENGDELSVKGNILDHEYEFERSGHKIGEVSKRWFRVRDTYGIEVAPGENDALIVAAAVCIDEMARGQAAGWEGLSLSEQFWAVAALGGAFRTTVELDPDQAVVTTGAYKSSGTPPTPVFC